MSAYIIPALLTFILIYGKLKKVNLYDGFVCGAKKGLILAIDILPYILTIMLAVSVFRASGLAGIITGWLTPIFGVFGMPSEVCELIILKPFSGSGSLALLTDIYSQYGVDSYVARCASVIMGSSETTFYISAVYMSKCSYKKLAYAVPVSLIVSFVGAIVACALCKIM